MKTKAIFLLSVSVVFLVTFPVFATVIVQSTDLGGGVAEFTYDATTEPVLIRGFALEITVDSGATIESIFDFKVGESTADDPGYGIFPMSHPDNPIVPGNQPGAEGTGLGTNIIIVEMSSLYTGVENAPLPADCLFKISIDWYGSSTANITMAEDPIRGGIVMEDPDCQPTVSLIGCTMVSEPSTLLLLGLGAVRLLRRYSV